MIPEIILATENEHKAKEISHFARHAASTLHTLSTVNISLPEGLEIFQDYHGNALAKAEYIWNQTHLPVLSDDSGLEVDMLGGRPGIHSARYSPEGNDKANRLLLLQHMENIPYKQRCASFVCVLCWLTSSGVFYFEGRSQGYILEKQRGLKGFGYDPLFFDPKLNKTYAELSFEEKIAVSHRGKALEKWINFITTEGGI